MPLIMIIITSLVMGANIRTMWMTPFYIFFGTFIYFLRENINFRKLKNVLYDFFIFIFLFHQ